MTSDKALTKQQLSKQIRLINLRQKGEAFPKQMVCKLVGEEKTWKALKKEGLVLAIAAWNELMGQCPQTANWQTVKTSDRIISLIADGKRWVDYFGFRRMASAEKFIEQILPHCKWVAIRKSGKRLNASIECKVWGLEQEQFDLIVAKEKTASSPKMAMLYYAIGDGKFQTYIKTAESDKIEEYNCLTKAELSQALNLCQRLGGQIVPLPSRSSQIPDLAAMVS